MTAPPLVRHGTPDFRRINVALVSAGFATFALLYCVQPLLPVFATDFHVTAAQSSLSLSLATGLLAPAMIVAGMLSEARGRKAIMVGSMFASALLTVLSAFAPRWGWFLAARALSGVTFAGLPAVSMAYLSEEVDPASVGLAMGLAIGGNGLGGMIGRLMAALITGWLSWRWALGIIGALGLVTATIFWRTLPPSRQFVARPQRPLAILRTFGNEITNPRLMPLYAIGFLLMGAFVATWNYVTYHLVLAPYSLNQAGLGFIFLVYPLGIVASAWVGARADRVGRRKMLLLMIATMLVGIAITLLRPLPLVIAGVATLTVGFFGGHSVASSWIGLRATQAKAQAAALYLFCYYVGASVAGSAGGVFWSAAGWPGAVGFIASLLLGGLAMAIMTAR